MTALRGEPFEEQMQPRRLEDHEDARRRFATETQRHRAETRRTSAGNAGRPPAPNERQKRKRQVSHRLCFWRSFRAVPPQRGGVRRVDVWQRALRSLCLCASVAKIVDAIAA